MTLATLRWGFPALVLLLAPLAHAQTCPSPGTEWAAPVDGNWGDASNWTNGVPNASTNACILAGGSYTVSLDVTGNALGLVLGRSAGAGTQTLLNTSQQLNLNAASTINAQGVYDWQGGRTGGSITLTNNGLIALSGTALKDIAGGTTIRNEALTTLDGTGNLRFFGAGSVFVNAAGATFDVHSDADFQVFNGGNTFDNDGLFQKSGGTDVSLVSQGGTNLTFDNSGTVSALSGTIQFDGNGTHDSGIITAASGAEVFFNTGTHTIVTSITGTPTGTVRMDAGATMAFGLGGTIDFDGTGFEWQGGTVSGTVTNDGLLRLTTGDLKDLAGNATLTNTGTVEHTDTGNFRFFGSGSQFVNASGALFDLQSDADFQIFNGGNAFTNDGTFRKSGGTGVSLVSLGGTGLAFNNNATVRAQSGAIQFDGNGTHDGGTFTASLGAEVFFNGGTHTVVGTISGEPDGTVRFDAGATLVDDGSGATMDFGGTGFEWQGGTVSGTVTNDGLLRLTTGALKDIAGSATLTNTGTVEHTDTGNLRFFGSGSQFVNASGALFDLQSDADFQIFNGGNAFTNNGTFVKTGGTDVSVVSVSGLDFDNNQTVRAESGTIQFDGNGTHDGGTFTASLGAEVYFNAGTHTVVGTISGEPDGTVRLDAGATLAGGTMDFGGTGFEWQGGTVSGTVTNDGLLRLTTGDLKDLAGNATLTNTGTVEHTDTGNFRFFGSGSQFVNAPGGTFEIQSDADFQIFNGGNSVSNSGLFQKTGGAGVSQVSQSGLAFTNGAGGVVSAESGIIEMDGTVVHTGDALFQGTATLDVSGASLIQDGATGPGTSPGVLAWTGNWAPTDAGTDALIIEIGGNGGAGAADGHDQLQVSGGATANGTLGLRLFGEPELEVGDSFTILTASSVSGTFDAVEAPNGFAFDVDYNADNIVVTITTITPDNADPVITSLEGDTTGDEGDTFSFTASAADDDGDDLTYTYDFGDGSPEASGVGLTEVNHVYADEGTYTLTLTVDDGNGATDTGTLTVTVSNAAPVIVSLTGDQAGDAGDTFEFVASASDPGEGDVLTYTYDFGDGSPEASGVDLTEVSHIYDTADTYTLTLTVTDGDGGSDTATLAVTVNEPPPPGDPLVVVNTDDSGPGSLRAAMTFANDNPNTSGLDVISFNVPGAGPHVIQPQSALPILTDPVVIDGLTETGASCGDVPSLTTLQIVIDGSNAGNVTAGIYLRDDAAGSTIRGLVINNFQGANNSQGRGLFAVLPSGLTVECNFVGTDVTGLEDRGNAGVGVFFFGSLGGNTVAANLISGNGLTGFEAEAAISLTADFTASAHAPDDADDDATQRGGRTALSPASGDAARGSAGAPASASKGGGSTFLARNFIGTDATGNAPLGNDGDGVLVENIGGVIVGGPENSNVISGNGDDGVNVEGSLASSTLVQTNSIGVGADICTVVANADDGVDVDLEASDLQITDNVITGNGDDGVVVERRASASPSSATSSAAAAAAAAATSATAATAWTSART